MDRAAKRIYQREYRAKNRDKVRAMDREAARAWYARNREAGVARQVQRRRAQRARLAAIKLAAGCMDCGYRVHHAAMDFDHRPGETKSFAIAGSGGQRSWSSIEAEVAKCDVVCANCHRVRTWRRLQDSA